MEDSAAAALDPYAKVETDFLFTLKYANKKVAPTTGKKIDISYKKVKLVKVAKSSVADFSGLDLGFRNVDSTTIKWY